MKDGKTYLMYVLDNRDDLIKKQKNKYIFQR